MPSVLHRVSLAALALVLAGSLPAAAQWPEAAARAEAKEPASPVSAVESRETPRRDDGRRTLGRLPRNLGRGLIGVFARPTLAPLLIGGTATAISSGWDDETACRSECSGSFARTGAWVGGPWLTGGLTLALFTGGRFAQGEGFRAMSYDLLVGTVVNLAYTEALKTAVQRERPNRANHQSFPSGHTSNAFTLASIAEHHYGWKVGLPAYTVAALIGASRVEKGAHHLSDVMAGATLGFIVGKAVTRQDEVPLARTVTLAPVFGSGRSRGLSVSVVF